MSLVAAGFEGRTHLRVDHKDPAFGRGQDDPVVGGEVVPEKAVHVPRLDGDLWPKNRLNWFKMKLSFQV